MDVRIGIQHHPREINFETDESPEQLRATVEAGLSGDALITFTDNKGKQYFVPGTSIAYIETGATPGRKVGFVS